MIPALRPLARHAAIFIGSAALGLGQAVTPPTGLWDFSSGTAITSATIGSNLTVAGATPVHSAALADDVGNSQSGVITTVGGTANRLVMPNPVGANGGGTYTNEYTFLFDIFSPAGSRSSWRSLFQTNQGNSNDAEYFIRNSDDKIGIASPLGYSTNPLPENRWVRLVLACDINATGTTSTIRAYVDGVLFHTHSFSGGLNGAYGLESNVLLFADNNSENAALNVGTVGFWGKTLTATEAQALGAAGTPIGGNQAPVITEGSSFTLPQAALNGPAVTGTLHATDADGDTITWTVEAPAANGTATVSGADTQAAISYTPDTGFTGTDTFRIRAADAADADTIEITVLVRDPAANEAPVITEGNTFALPQATLNGGAVSGTLHVTDANADAITWTLASTPANGAAVLGGATSSQVTVQYTPAAGFSGTDRFEVRATDGSGASDTIEVTVTVTNPGVPSPVGLWQFDYDFDTTVATLGRDLTPVGAGFTPVAGTRAGDGAVLVAQGSHYAVDHAISGGNGGGSLVNEYTLLYDILLPSNGWKALLQTDTTNASDAEVFINASNQIGGSAVLGGYSSSSLSNNTWYRVVMTIDNGTARRIYVNGQQWYQGTAGTVDNNRHALGSLFLLFADEDGEDGPLRVTNFAIWPSALNASQVMALGGPATTIADTPAPDPNHPPVITGGGSHSINAGRGVPATVQFQATDEDMDPLTWTISRQPANGQAVLAGNSGGTGTVVYTSRTDFTGTDSFALTVSDGRKSATVSVSVNIVNSPPSIGEGENYLLSAVINGGARTATFTGTDPNGNELAWSVTTEPQHGTASLTPGADGTVEVSYTPATDYSGPDSFVVTLSDGLETDSILVTVSVADPNADPVLTVISPYGSPQPPVGANTFSTGTSVTPAVSDVILADSRHYVAGWTMTGDGPHEGTGGTFTTTLTRSSTLTWLWRTEHLMQFAVSGNGTISAESGWHDASLPLQVTATPAAGHFFSGWSGDTAGCLIGGKTIVIPMDRPRAAITATFTPNRNFTVIALPDTQNYTSDTNGIFSRQTEWIRNNTETLNIRFVTHLGDLVNSPTNTSQWTSATNAMNILNTRLPYGTCPGNHDLANGSNHYLERFGPNPTHSSSIGRWVDPSTGGRYDWYRGASPRGYSSYQVVPIDGRDFLFLHLDMDCPNEDLVWASGVLDAHPRMLTVITTHNYLAESGGSGAYGSGTGQRGYTAQANIASIAPARNKPETIFQTLVKPYNQVFMVICGHNFAIYNLQKTNNAGNTVHEVLCDYQSLPNGGNGFLRIMDFRPSENKIYNTTFSPTLGRYIDPNLAADRQGMLDLHDPNGGEFVIDLDFDHRFDSNLTIASTHDAVTPAKGTHRYADGTPVVISASEHVEGQTRYRPVGWTLTGGRTLSGTGSSATLIHQGNSTLTWSWSTEHRLETSTTGDGLVSVASGWQTAGANVTIVAQPDPGAAFQRWSGDIIGCTLNGDRITVPIDRPRGPITAEFSSSVPTWPVQVVSAFPSVNPAPATYSYEAGSTVTFTASGSTAAGARRICTGYTLSGAVNESGSGSQVTLTISGETTLTWHWRSQYQVTAEATGPGSVSPSSAWVDESQPATLTGTPEAGAQVASWTGDTADGIPAGNSFSITSVTRPMGPIVANFAVGMHSLTIVSAKDSVTPAAGTVSVPHGTVIRFSAVPAVSGRSRSVPSGWTLAGEEDASGTEAGGTFVVNADTIFTWQWSEEVFLALSSGFEGKVHPLGVDGWKAKGSTVELRAEPATGFRFVKWNGDVPDGPASASITLTMDQPRQITPDATPLATASGTPHWWLDRNTTVIAGDYEAADAADADQDGRTAREEFISGTSDLDPGRHLKIRDFVRKDSDGPKLGFVWQSALNRDYYILGSPDLATPFGRVAGPYAGAWPVTGLDLPVPGGGRHFYKVQATLSPGGLLDADSPALSPEPAPESLVRKTQRIPSGWFTQGEDTGGQDTRPAHQAWIPGLEMDKFEVTRGDWEKVAAWGASHGYDLPVTLPYNAAADEPAVALSWYSAVKWCNARSEMEGRVPAYYADTEGIAVYRSGKIDLTSRHVNWAGNGYRLPTEAEWERSSRGGLEGQRFPWGADDGLLRANHWDYQLYTGRAPSNPYPYLQRVGYFDGTQPGGAPDTANAYGLYDMVGNAWEWTWNRMGSYSADAKVSPTGPDTGEFRVLRGGSWWMYLDQATNFQRLSFPPDGSDDYGMLGFRTVRGLHPNEVRPAP